MAERKAERPHVRIDPAQRFGRPSIKGVSTEAIAGMVRAGEDFDTVAGEYDLTRHEVILACWWEGSEGGVYRKKWREWARDVFPMLGGWTLLDLVAVGEPPQKEQP